MRRSAPSKGKKPRSSQLAMIPVPTAGWISNRNLAMPTGSPEGPGAEVMDNWFPTASSARLRRGTALHEELPTTGDVKSLFTYSSGGSQRLFAANDSGIYEVTTTASGVLWPCTNGEWITIQFSTAGGSFVIGVNGTDEAFIFDGTSFDALNITFPAPMVSDTSAFSFVWAYKQRIYFIGKDSLSAWYLPVDSIGGAVEELPLGGVFNRGGVLLWGQTWSLSSGGDGGLSEQCAFCTSVGEVAIYQGLSPDSAVDWSKVGVYSIGAPMGKRAFIRAGGDLVVATTIGFIPLSRAIDLDQAALGVAAVSNKIADAWREAVTTRGNSDWVCELWGEGSMIVVAPPKPRSIASVAFVANADTGAWGRFTNWQPTAMEVFNGNLMIGTTGGRVLRAWTGGNDEGLPYTGTLIPLFNDFGTPGQRKIAKVARAVKRSKYAVDETITATFDWKLQTPPAPNAITVEGGNEWGTGIWGQAVWGATTNSVIQEDWRSVGGSGYAASIILQITSGMDVPLDVELVRIDMSYDTADIIS